MFQENTERYVTVKVMRAQKMTKTIYRLLEFACFSSLDNLVFVQRPEKHSVHNFFSSKNHQGIAVVIRGSMYL